MIWGENGSGKTSLLEAVHILSLGKSFRTGGQKEIIKKGKESFVVRGRFIRKRRDHEVSVLFNKNSGQAIKINGKKFPSRKDLVGKTKVVVLSPEEQNITKGGPEQRRRFFDKVFSIVDTKYLQAIQTYNRILKQRNAALVRIKEGRGFSNEISSWNIQLIESGLLIWKIRQEFIRDFNSEIQLLTKKYEDKIEIELSCPLQNQDSNSFHVKLQKHQKTDIRLGRTSVGPHRDVIDVLWSKNNLRKHGSQGEHKLTLVFLKLAELVFTKNKTNTFPILLLDDLFSKLDFDRSRKLVDLLKNIENNFGESIQTIITTTDMINIKNSGIFKLHDNTKTHHLNRECSR